MGRVERFNSSLLTHCASTRAFDQCTSDNLLVYSGWLDRDALCFSRFCRKEGVVFVLGVLIVGLVALPVPAISPTQRMPAISIKK